MTIDKGQAIQAVTLTATALFLMSRLPGLPFRRAAMIGAIALYGLAVGIALVWVGLWLLGAGF